MTKEEKERLKALKAELKQTKMNARLEALREEVLAEYEERVANHTLSEQVFQKWLKNGMFEEMCKRRLENEYLPKYHTNYTGTVEAYYDAPENRHLAYRIDLTHGVVSGRYQFYGYDGTVIKDLDYTEINAGKVAAAIAQDAETVQKLQANREKKLKEQELKAKEV